MCIDGKPKFGGISEKQTARQPRSAFLLTSAAAKSASQRGIIISGRRAPLESPHHSSTMKSLYAFTQAKASSRSLASAKV